ncbi:YoaK family protein [soil metagenome]
MAMDRYDSRSISLAVTLAGIAGFVDAVGFLSLGNVFVSFMSGNSTRLAVAISESRFDYAGLLLGVILLFVVGVVVGSIVGKRAKRRRSSILRTVAGLLILAVIAHHFGEYKIGTALMVLAMGCENAIFQSEGEVIVGLTYMTGTLVRLGNRIAARLSGDKSASWSPYVLLWLGLVTGATLGGFGDKYMGSLSLVIPVIVCVGLSVSRES